MSETELKSGIVERLREIAVVAEHQGESFDFKPNPLFGDAAAIIESQQKEIEALQAIIRDATDWFDRHRPQCGPGTLPTWVTDGLRHLLNGGSK